VKGESHNSHGTNFTRACTCLSGMPTRMISSQVRCEPHMRSIWYPCHHERDRHAPHSPWCVVRGPLFIIIGWHDHDLHEIIGCTWMASKSLRSPLEGRSSKRRSVPAGNSGLPWSNHVASVVQPWLSRIITRPGPSGTRKPRSSARRRRSAWGACGVASCAARSRESWTARAAARRAAGLAGPCAPGA